MLRILVAAVLALGMAAPAAAEVVDSSTGHFVTRDSVTVKATPKAAWLALITPGEWWDDTHTWSGAAANMSIIPQGGGCFCERIPARRPKSRAGITLVSLMTRTSLSVRYSVISENIRCEICKSPLSNTRSRDASR